MEKGNRSLCSSILLALFFVIAHTPHADGRYSGPSQGLEYQRLQLDTSSAAGFRVTSTRRTGFIGESKVPDESKNGLVASLWHRYSANSPFLPENSTRQSLIKDSLLRDKQRIAMFSGRIELASLDLKLSDLTVPQNDLEVQSQTAAATIESKGSSDLVSPVVSGLTLGSGEYFTRVQVGTPGLSTYLVMDTGSDILWLQCAACRNCYSQQDPLFNPKNSSSYGDLPCSSGWCKDLDMSGCSKNNRCLYQVSYGDGSFTVGDLSVETFTLGAAKGGTQVIKNVAFGCGHDNEGLFVGAAGILGLGKGPLAFSNQVGDPYSRKFSYCLGNRDTGNASPSSLIFGDAAAPSSSKVKFTPQVYNEKIRSLYYVGLTGISVGGSLLGIPTATFDLETTGKGGVIIDSGTSISWLKETGYIVVRDAFRAATSHLPYSAAPFQLFDTCFDLSNHTAVDVPTLTMHFQGGADLELPANNYVIPVDDSGRYCLALAPSSSNFSIIGNVQQQNFRVVYDNENSRIGFIAEQCG